MVDDKDPPSSESRLCHSNLVEDLILERAQEFGFELYTIIRPSMIRNGMTEQQQEQENGGSPSLERRRQLEYPKALDTVSLLEMVGAAILVFRKTKNYYGF